MSWPFVLLATCGGGLALLFAALAYTAVAEAKAEAAARLADPTGLEAAIVAALVELEAEAADIHAWEQEMAGRES